MASTSCRNPQISLEHDQGPLHALVYLGLTQGPYLGTFALAICFICLVLFYEVETCFYIIDNIRVYFNVVEN